MISVSVFYPHTAGKSFDYVYYADKHMPMVMDKLASHGLLRYEIHQGVSGMAPGSDPLFSCTGVLYFNEVSEFAGGMAVHGAEILADIPNYTQIAPQIQISQLG
jgi:uncharacterized protein (TIGR02118 family)